MELMWVGLWKMYTFLSRPPGQFCKKADLESTVSTKDGKRNIGSSFIICPLVCIYMTYFFITAFVDLHHQRALCVQWCQLRQNVNAV